MEQISSIAVSLLGTNVENDLDWECLLGVLIILDMLALSPGHATNWSFMKPARSLIHRII